MIAYTIAELQRRLENMVRIGTVESVDVAAARCRVRIAGMLSGPLPFTADRAGAVRTWLAPSVGEQVEVLAPFGDLSQAYVGRSIYRVASPAPSADAAEHMAVYPDGARIRYNSTTHALSATLPGGGTAALVADGGVHVTGTITVVGDVVANGISLTGHMHGGVTPGGSNTGGPV